jgi:soluble cytochrome b562
MNEYQTVMDKTIEALVDQLHSLACEGRLSEAKEIAAQIKELQKTGV